MKQPKLTKLELQILESLWVQGKASIREIQEAFSEPRPAYTTIQTTMYRLEGKKAYAVSPRSAMPIPSSRRWPAMWRATGCSTRF